MVDPVCTASQIIDGDFAKFCGLLRIYELYKTTFGKAVHGFCVISKSRLWCYVPSKTNKQSNKKTNAPKNSKL